MARICLSVSPLMVICGMISPPLSFQSPAFQPAGGSAPVLYHSCPGQHKPWLLLSDPHRYAILKLQTPLPQKPGQRRRQRQGDPLPRLDGLHRRGVGVFRFSAGSTAAAASSNRSSGVWEASSSRNACRSRRYRAASPSGSSCRTAEISSRSSARPSAVSRRFPSAMAFTSGRDPAAAPGVQAAGAAVPWHPGTAALRRSSRFHGD